MRLLRRWAILLAMFALCISSTGITLYAQSSSIQIYLDGRKIDSDVPPYILTKVNVTMVPLRVISEGLGASADWSQSSKTVTITKSGHELKLTNGLNTASVNGMTIKLETSVQIKQGRVMVPLRFVSEQLGLQVVWNQKAQTIVMTSSDGNHESTSLRGAWVSTIYNLDWPTVSSYGKIEQQKQEYIALLDDLQSMGMNSVFVQVRPSSDAIYPSKLVPWSKFLTGTQGKDPGYDPLQFMIEETHNRGMQFHAWFNPFRANTTTNKDQLAANHVVKAHPDWIVSQGGQLYINPGIPDARKYVLDVIMEVVRNYDIDGVHLDDYFYPSGESSSNKFNDDDAFRAYNSKGFTSKGDWRRNNINEFVQQLGYSIHEAKPGVQFGISPFGVWRNQKVDPLGSDTKAGITSYDDMYADVRTWIKSEWIDYVAPQIYWSLSNASARYDKVVDWWVRQTSDTNVQLYIGHAIYKVGTNEAGWQSADEIINQLKYNEQYPQINGSIFFSSKDLRKNPLGIKEALHSYYQ
ncbi:family 10 glycosylhydrolase [Paenibacillus sediminis]|uniref:Uncharacterized lipoprotein YddW (UPF0748 family) n=1 Tax=Paenibacillus sediminis TaxID=664909 RepID=A0ABS4GZE5_9BACL|nr:family 10 glycosylhydrolase [Paenibacillus sediminis]MBP1935638.1 uncharacterized lipoprotein YddW (UPF0748 family) [Paenibacillus sediminis]